jgi:hypothetical protein
MIKITTFELAKKMSKMARAKLDALDRQTRPEIQDEHIVPAEEIRWDSVDYLTYGSTESIEITQAQAEVIVRSVGCCTTRLFFSWEEIVDELVALQAKAYLRTDLSRIIPRMAGCCLANRGAVLIVRSAECCQALCLLTNGDIGHTLGNEPAYFVIG